MIRKIAVKGTDKVLRWDDVGALAENVLFGDGTSLPQQLESTAQELREAIGESVMEALKVGQAGGVVPLGPDGKVAEALLPSLIPYEVGSTAPEDTKKLWIDTTEGAGGLKYWNGSTWTHVPVAYT